MAARLYLDVHVDKAIHDQLRLRGVDVLRALDDSAAEFAVLVRSDLKGQGLGTLLMHKLIRYCRERGTGELRGDVMTENAAMLQLARRLGFKVRGTEGNIETIALALQQPPAARAV